MNRRKSILWILLGLGITALSTTGCRRQGGEAARALEFDAFIPVYNEYIKEWIRKEQRATEAEAAKVAADIPLKEGDARETLEIRARALEVDREKWRFRVELGDYLKIGTPADIPADLVWKDGMEQPEIGDPASKKGGVFRRYIPSFPPTIRPVGDNANNSFRGDLYDYIDMPLVVLHPETMKEIPGLAKEWATSEDGRTTFFRIHPDARYSDGRPVTSRDFLVSVYVRVSDNIVNPYSKQYYRENFAQVATYDDHTLSISLPEPKAYSAAIAGAMVPSHPEFYSEYGPDYSERYQWRFPPTTGAYEVLPEDIVNGVSITQTRVKDWWAKDNKYYKYRFNPDKLVHKVVRDESKAMELFRAGEFDSFLITLPKFWYEKTEIQPVYDGYIERTMFYNRYPKLPRGLYLNVSKAPLDNKDVRIGIHYATNWQKVIDVLFRGDYQRLNAFNEGMGEFSDPSIVARPFSVAEARASFAKAGYTEEDRDGILKRPDGTRLTASITYPAMPMYDQIFAILREEARACGFDLRLDGQEATASYKKIQLKQHEMTFGAWVIQPPVPDFHQFLHSSNAIDDKGNPKTQTNNTFVWHRADTDVLSDKVRSAQTAEELKEAAWKLQNIMHDEGIFVPGYSVDFSRVGCWRWVRWPDCPETRFCPPVVFDPHEVFVFWVDEEIQEETQAARRSGKTYPEVTRIVEDYRMRPVAATPEEDEPAEEPAAEPETSPATEENEDS